MGEKNLEQILQYKLFLEQDLLVISVAAAQWFRFILFMMAHGGMPKSQYQIKSSGKAQEDQQKTEK